MDLTYENVISAQRHPLQPIWRTITEVVNFNNRSCLCDHFIENESKGYICDDTCLEDCKSHSKCQCPYPTGSVLTLF